MNGSTGRALARALVLALIGIVVSVGGVGAQDTGITVQVLGQGHTDYGEAIGGPADVLRAVLTVAPGASTGWHTHAGPVMAVVSRGELTIYEHDGCQLQYPTGSVRFEIPGDVHEGRNETTQPVELVVTYVIPAGGETSSAASAPTATCSR